MVVNPLAVFAPKLRGLKLELGECAPSKRAPKLTAAPELLASLAVEPGWLARVHTGKFDKTDSEMHAIIAKARSNNATFVVREVHGLELVYRKRKHDVLQLMLPKRKGIYEACMLELHSSLYSAHMGVCKTIAALHYHFWWPKLPQHVSHFVKGCPVCQRVKDTKALPGGLL